LKSDGVKWFEIIAVIITGLLKYVMMDWLNMKAFYIFFICLFWSVYVYFKYKANPVTLKEWGIQKRNFKPTFFFLLPFAVISMSGIGIYGYIAGTNVLNRHILYILLLYPLWGLIQQFMVAGLISGKLKALENPRFTNYQIILLTSLLFSLAHYPSGFLMIFTFMMQWIFTTAFLRWKNIWPLGLFHGWIGAFLLFYVMGRDLWAELLASF
jgi:membrane protease YdiL (CAAX protease family)